MKTRKTITTLKRKMHDFLHTAAARYNEFILSEQFRIQVQGRAVLCTIEHPPTGVHKGHHYQPAVKRWEVIQMSEYSVELGSTRCQRYGTAHTRSNAELSTALTHTLIGLPGQVCPLGSSHPSTWGPGSFTPCCCTCNTSSCPLTLFANCL